MDAITQKIGALGIIPVAVIEGVATPSEITAALKYDLHILKFFPAQAHGGIGFLKAIRDPFPKVRFIPTGGTNPDNLPAYLRMPWNSLQQPLA
jgi:2-dehydro-3-deoxyphosphogluconate aldolase/(4S)-4-hydroxy-2-oxoglutarate aldolase